MKRRAAREGIGRDLGHAAVDGDAARKRGVLEGKRAESRIFKIFDSRKRRAARKGADADIADVRAEHDALDLGVVFEHARLQDDAPSSLRPSAIAVTGSPLYVSGMTTVSQAWLAYSVSV